MQALVLEEYSTNYTLKQLVRPVPAAGQVLVRIKVSGVNPLDLKIKAGQAAHAKTQLPAILGIDMAGIVESVGDGVTLFKLGDEVFGMTGGIAGLQGSLAEYAAVDADLLAHKPKRLTMREAAALPLAFITAWEGLVDRANVGNGKNVLIQGGSGGVGSIAVQLAKAKDANVFATDKPAKKPFLESLGATFIDYTHYPVDEYLQEYTQGEGFDIIFDTVGGTTLDASFQAVKTYTGHVVSILGWGTHTLAPLSFRGATYSGVFTLLPLITGIGRKHHGEILREASQLADTGLLIPSVDPVYYTMQTIEDAYIAFENRQNNGKVVIEI
ncbi:zinc-dependent alcohol dehydrogenase family protein [Xanthocytophaga agilis]|uniref:Zinc-dependent alcohol dehydrogenase family protein n=1 Tax=Xanthocytophaga agilis TaxID=3048010 RepID=A0AAE3UEW0_9BACT|nr:zinc-dependent alcohol dehydrogenase family protein [Xanthocytophaga agilis]MDJ1499953.1 zinc-dependent alcohol dehydrogenase family protein [Xanthocytophaga agilis]